MEHLPLRHSTEKSLFPLISCYCSDKYDQGSFLDFPQRLGMPQFETVGIVPGRLRPMNQRFLAALPSAILHPFLQVWLFFGLLHMILGDLFDHDDYIITTANENGGKTVISTAKLCSQVEAWEHQIKQNGKPSESEYEHISKCLYLTYACLKVPYPDLDDDFKLHLASVAETVGYAASKAYDIAWTDNPARVLIPLAWGDTISEDFRREMLFRRSNCCLSQWEMLLHEFKSPHALCIVADSFYENAESQHEACNVHNCQLRQSKPPRHLDKSCQCAYISVDEAQLTHLLERGDLPLIRIQHETYSDKVSVEVIASSPSSSYVALSHVWTDGLGNPEATALPRCQLLRLKSLIDKLNTSTTLRDQDSGPEILLWCDTLCCPVVSENAKRIALSQMYRTYDKASVVLVLEEALGKHRVNAMDLCEASLQVVLSRWMTRLWTLQEGALPARANKLLFQFKDIAVPGWTLYHHIATVSRRTIQLRGIAPDIMRRFYTFTDLFKAQIDSNERQAGQFRDIMSGLQYRSVTVPTDEPLLVATLLALDLAPILATPAVDRMNTLWRLLGRSSQGIPRDLLFRMGPKLSERGLRWAPQSLLSGNEHFFFRRAGVHEDRGFLAEDEELRGLKIHLAGLRIKVVKPARRMSPLLAGYGSLPRDNLDRDNVLLKDKQGVWYMLCHRLSGEPDCPSHLESLSDSISKLSDPWILYHGVGTSEPAPRGYDGLLVDEIHVPQVAGDQTKSVEIRLHTKFGRLPMTGSQCCEVVCRVAYSLAQELSSSAVAMRFEELEDAKVDPRSPEFLQVAGEIDSEIAQLSQTTTAMEALVASGNRTDEQGTACVAAYIERFYRGIYLDIEDVVPGDSVWFVD